VLSGPRDARDVDDETRRRTCVHRYGRRVGQHGAEAIAVAVDQDEEGRLGLREAIDTRAGGPGTVYEAQALARLQRASRDFENHDLLVRHRFGDEFHTFGIAFDRRVSGQLGYVRLRGSPAPEGRALQEDHAALGDSFGPDLESQGDLRRDPDSQFGGLGALDPGAPPAVGGVALALGRLAQAFDDVGACPGRVGRGFLLPLGACGRIRGLGSRPPGRVRGVSTSQCPGETHGGEPVDAFGADPHRRAQSSDSPTPPYSSGFVLPFARKWNGGFRASRTCWR
jgi:hypothetical protein